MGSGIGWVEELKCKGFINCYYLSLLLIVSVGWWKTLECVFKIIYGLNMRFGKGLVSNYRKDVEWLMDGVEVGCKGCRGVFCIG